VSQDDPQIPIFELLPAFEEETGVRVRPGLGASRLQQLKRDLALTPEQRVREAEETALLTQPRESARVHQLMAFDRYEDFLQWQRLRDLLP